MVDSLRFRRYSETFPRTALGNNILVLTAYTTTALTQAVAANSVLLSCVPAVVPYVQQYNLEVEQHPVHLKQSSTRSLAHRYILTYHSFSSTAHQEQSTL